MPHRKAAPQASGSGDLTTLPGFFLPLTDEGSRRATLISCQVIPKHPLQIIERQIGLIPSTIKVAMNYYQTLQNFGGGGGAASVCYIFMSIIYLTATQRRDIFLLLIHFLQEPGLGQGKARSEQLQPGCRPAVWQGPTHLYQLLLPLILCYQEVAALMGDPVYPRGSLTHCATRIATRKSFCKAHSKWYLWAYT